METLAQSTGNTRPISKKKGFDQNDSPAPRIECCLKKKKVPSHVDGPRDCHTEWSKSDLEGEVSYDTWNLKRSDTDEPIYKTQTLLENTLAGVGRGSLGKNEEKG